MGRVSGIRVTNTKPIKPCLNLLSVGVTSNLLLDQPLQFLHSPSTLRITPDPSRYCQRQQQDERKTAGEGQLPSSFWEANPAHEFSPLSNPRSPEASAHPPRGRAPSRSPP